MKLKLTILIFLVILVCSCRKYNLKHSPQNIEVTAMADLVVASPEELAEKEAERNSNQQKNTDLDKRKIIRDGDITIETDSIARGKKFIELLVKKYDGYLSDEKFVIQEGPWLSVASGYAATARVTNARKPLFIFALLSGLCVKLLLSYES